MTNLILDTEVYSNYFLISFLTSDSKKTISFDMFDDSFIDKKTIAKIMSNAITVGFNSNNYDLPIIAAMLSGHTNQELKTLSDKIIFSDSPSWLILREECIEIPTRWNHIDIIELPIGQSSLKIYGGRMHAPKLQDLPIVPNAIIELNQCEDLRTYCFNDLETTLMLYNKLLPQITLREDMSKQYGIDLRSKSDAQIAETVLKSELQKIMGGTIKKPSIPAGTVFKYKVPSFIKFETELLKDVLEVVKKADFIIEDSGSVKLPKEMADKLITINTSTYRMGIGGLHSTEESRTTIAKDGYIICDKDCASFYPNIILGQGLYPRQYGKDFLKVYQGIVDRRIAAKKSGDKITADVLKIVINGSYGKFGSKYSTLYAPDLMIQTTISGQLALLMLIERYENNGIAIISANTDGIVTYYKEEQTELVEHLAYEWELDTGYELEDTFYKSLHCRDVNNYIAIKPDGKTKGKGLFAESGLSKNPQNSICTDAVANFLTKGSSIEDTIYKCTDITRFVSLRSVKGGGVWNGNFIGKTVRWYYAENCKEPIKYKTNGNKVPKTDGAKPIMNLPNELPDDINYEWYINEAKTILKGLTNAGIDNRKTSSKTSKGSGLFDI